LKPAPLLGILRSHRRRQRGFLHLCAQGSVG
jgi:hypothetical protein